jgi:hypothetical protein
MTKHAAGKSSPDQRSETTNVTSSANDIQSKVGKGRSKKASGAGMFSSWFNEPSDYDEEEDSKTWEPWSLFPSSPTSCCFSLPTPVPSPPPVKKGKPQPDKVITKPQPAKKSKLQTKAAVKEDRSLISQGHDRPRGPGKQDKSQKSTGISKPTAPVPNIPTALQRSSPTTNRLDTSVQKPPVKIVLKKRTNLFTLPLEVRDKIYGHLLTATIPVQVMRSFTQCGARYRGGLEPAILSACRQTYAEGIRILYSTNTFLYRIRDTGDPLDCALHRDGYLSPLTVSLAPPPAAELAAAAAAPKGKGGRAPAKKRPRKTKIVVLAAKKSTVGDVYRVIYLAKYAHLFRRVEIELESNRSNDDRYRPAMAKAIQILGAWGVRLTSLQFSLTPLQTGARPGVSPEWTVIDFFSSPRNSMAAAAQDSAEVGGSARKKVAKADNHSVMEPLRNLNVQLLHFTVYTPSSRRLDMTLDMSHRNNTLKSTSGQSTDGWARLLAHDNLIAQQRQEVASASSEAFENLRQLILEACAETDKAVRSGWWTEYGPPQVAAVRSAMEGEETMKEKIRRFRSPWYEKVRRDYAENSLPERSCCVRKVGRKLMPADE